MGCRNRNRLTSLTLNQCIRVGCSDFKRRSRHLIEDSQPDNLSTWRRTRWVWVFLALSLRYSRKIAVWHRRWKASLKNDWNGPSSSLLSCHIGGFSIERELLRGVGSHPVKALFYSMDTTKLTLTGQSYMHLSTVCVNILLVDGKWTWKSVVLVLVLSVGSNA